MRFIRWVCATSILVCLAAGGATAQDRVWGLNGTYGEIIATDCVGCGEDIGMSIACQGDFSNARVEVPFAAAQRFSEGTYPITLTTDRGDSYSFESSLVERGLVGFVPVFELPANHPLVEAMSSATTLQVLSGDVESYIGLGGSRQALEIFSAHCGWTQMPAYVAETAIEPETQPAAPDGDARWMIEQAVARDGSERLGLTFGIPDTDAILLSASCDMGLNTATLDLSVDFGGLRHGAATDLQITTRSGRFSYPGTVFVASEESAGVRVTVGGRAPLWRALQATDSVTFGVPGGAVSSLAAGDQDGVVASFIEGCFVAGANAIPVVQPTPPASVELPKAKPIEAPAVVSTPVVKEPVPAPVLVVPVAPPAAPAAAGGGSFACGDGSKVTVAISGPASAQVATVTVGSGAPLVLNGLPPTPSMMFAAGDAALVLKPNAIQLIQGAKLSDCTAQ